jgi:catechol 2,3-dioxygenase-like lactoylglutathione lyase family enzyme
MRRVLGRIWVWAVLAACLLRPGPALGQALEPAARRDAANGTIRAVAAVGFTVDDMDRSLDFFTRILGFETISDVEVAGERYERLTGVFPVRMRVARIRLGAEIVEMTDYLAPEGRPFPADARSNDRWFQHIAIVVSDMDRAYQRLRNNRVRQVSSGPQRLPDWNPNAGGIEAFYFRDPDGHVLELIWFPPGKGDARWQRPTDHLFLGIDHTAIGVSDTEASLAFYRDILGLRVAGESENYGPEQERLNAVFGARLRITGLRAANGPGIEFLEYLAPRDGRPMPFDEHSNDLMHWQTTLVTAGVDAVAQHLRQAKAHFVSTPVVDLPVDTLGFRAAFLVRDPDGHVMQVVQR